MYPHWLELYEELLTSYIFPCMLAFVEAICMLVRRSVCFAFEASFTSSLVFHFPHLVDMLMIPSFIFVFD
jgi:hypothetical protein